MELKLGCLKVATLLELICTVVLKIFECHCILKYQTKWHSTFHTILSQMEIKCIVALWLSDVFGVNVINHMCRYFTSSPLSCDPRHQSCHCSSPFYEYDDSSPVASWYGEVLIRSTL